MWGKTNIASNKKPNIERLIKYGFIKQDDGYIFSKNIMNDTFCLIVCVHDDETTLKVIDTATDEEYTLVYTDTVGVFVGSVRKACEDILNDIVNQCYESNLFKSSYTHSVIQYIEEKYGVAPSFLWKKLPTHAAFRNNETHKWFGVLSIVKKRTIGINKDGMIEILNLKETPENIKKLIDNHTYIAGYHMNKKHWYTMRLDGSVPIEELYKRIDISFNMLTKQLTNI